MLDLARLPQNIFDRIAFEPNSGCWLWTGGVSGYGYGHLQGWRHKKWPKAHRCVYEHLAGPIPDGMQLHHRCGIRICVNPVHLEVIDPVEHSRMSAKRHTVCRRGHPLSPENRRADGGGCRKCRSENYKLRRTQYG